MRVLSYAYTRIAIRVCAYRLRMRSSLISERYCRSFCFVLPTGFCVPECHCKRVESFTAAKVFFFSVSPFASEEKARSSQSPKERAYSD